jgi:hypothetical protein
MDRENLFAEFRKLSKNERKQVVEELKIILQVPFQDREEPRSSCPGQTCQ